ncbi:MAG: serpin family protein [Clostridiales bacterium]|nr:serpin family protein [Clostridiales bacterium]
MKKLVAVLLTTSVLLSMAVGCSGKTGKTRTSTRRETPTEGPLNENKEPGDVKTVNRKNGKQAVFELNTAGAGKTTMSEEELNQAYSEFIFALMKRCAENANGENVLISADSVLFALEMVAAGADGETLNQMMSTLVPGADNGEAFQFAVNRMNNLQNDSLKIANSVWLNDAKSQNVYSDYLDYVQRHFDATISVIPFNGDAVDMINGWVDEKTEGRIKELIRELTPNDLMVLINAITFDAKWAEPYSDEQVVNLVFTAGNGETKTTPFLSSTEVAYLSSDEAVGFLKDYDDGKYTFMTILPNDVSVDINEFIADMTAEEYWQFWNSRDMSGEVQALMPEFKSEYAIELQRALSDMGMKDAFDEDNADFSNMSSTDVYISKVIHKTYIEVDRAGTKAAAATAVVMTESTCAEPGTVHRVVCDRPYAYAIVDRSTGLPVFLGTVENV